MLRDMRARSCLAVLLLASAAFTQDDGDLVSKSELVHEIPADKSHPAPRKVIAAQEGDISCQPTSQTILVVHYRAQSTSQFSMNDDRLVVALKQSDKFRILKVLESDTTIVDDALISETDFDEEFIAVGGMHFLYIRTNFSGSGHGVLDDVYTISSDGKLSTISFEDVRNSKLLKAQDELRNGGYLLQKGVFTFESGVYKEPDGECCPSSGVFHAQFRLVGEFREDPNKHVFEPDFKFVVEKEWRSNDR